MTKNVVYKKPKWLRRVSSALIDLIATFVLALLLLFATTPISKSLFDANNAQEAIDNYLLESKLYYIDGSGEIKLDNSVSSFDDRLTYFYNTYTDKLEEYNLKKISNIELFDSEGNEILDSKISENKVKYLAFYIPISEECVDLYSAYLNNIDDYKNALNATSQALYFSILMAALIGFVVFYLIIPLIDKQGRTLGKMVFKLRLISKASIEARPSKTQILFRQLITILFEYVLTITTIGMFGFPLPIALIATILLVIFTKYNQSLHDILASTFLVDDYPSNQPINEGEKYILTYINVEE